MSPETMNDILPLLKEFVERNSTIKSLHFDPRLSPKLLINPYSNDYEEKKKAAHYFLLVASIDESKVIRTAENARALMVHLHEKLGEQTFELLEAKEFEEEVYKCKLYDEFGRLKDRIPYILVSVNEFVTKVGESDLIKYSQRFSKPKDMVEDLGKYVERMSGPIKKMAWLYMMWMVRPEPDLRIFDHFSPSDLFFPLTTLIARVAVSLGLMRSLWPLRASALRWEHVEKITEFARTLFPEDPVKVHYPLFLVGRWLKGKELNMRVLKETLTKFDDFYRRTGFSILLTKEKVGYSAECPALPGCITQGESEEEVLRNMEEAITAYLEAAEKYG